MTPLPTPVCIALAILVSVAAVADARNRTIPNSITVGGAAVGLILQTSIQGWSGLKLSLLGLGLGFLIFLPLFLLRGMGGGDVKLMAAIGAMSGPMNTFLIFVFTALIGGVFAVGLLILRGGMGRALGNLGHILASLVRLKAPHEERPELTIEDARAPKLPYALPMALGTLLLLLLMR